MRRSAVTPRPPERPQQAPVVDLMDPVIKAEIARQVALALHPEREERYYATLSVTSDRPSPALKVQPGPRLVRFPRKGDEGT
jgi:hypothetical protein